MTQNMLHTTWSEKIAQSMEEELDDSARKSTSGHRRTFNTTENETLLNHALRTNDIGLVPNVNLSDETTFQRRTRNRYLAADEVDYDTRNLSLKNSPSADTVYSRNSRNFSRSSPPGSYRSTRNTGVLSAHSSRREDNKDGVNIIMLIGFAIGIAFGGLFNIAEVYLKWLQAKITDFQLRLYDGKTIQDFYYGQEESIAKKLLYGPFSGLFLILQSVVYVVLISLNFLQRPAPKTLVSNVMMRYMNEQNS